MNDLHQRQLFSDDLPGWETLSGELQRTIEELLSLLLEHELTSSTQQTTKKEEGDRV